MQSLLAFSKSAWDSDIAYSLRHSPVALISLCVFLVLIISAIFAPWIAPPTPFDPASLVLMDGFSPPGEAALGSGTSYLFGTDDQGRDIFSTILYGMRLSLFIGIMAVLFAAVVGVTLGLIAGYFGGWIDAIIMRIADIQLTFPSILIAMLIFGIARGLTPPELRDQMAMLNMRDFMRHDHC